MSDKKKYQRLSCAAFALCLCVAHGARAQDAQGALSSRNAVELAAGTHHLCGRSASGEIVCEGANDYDQLGFDEGRNVPIPTPVPRLTDVTHIASSGG